MTKALEFNNLPTPSIDADNHINWQNRLIIMGSEYGFLPTSLGELNRAHMIIPFLDTPGKTAKHLNEVLINRNRDARAVRSVVRTLGEYALDAQERRARLESFRHDTELANPYLRVEVVEEACQHPGLVDALQFHEIKQAAIIGKSDPLRSKEVVRDGKRHRRTNYELDICNDALISILTDSLQQKEIREVRSLVGNAIDSHAARATFWTQRLQESRSHSVARPVADALLTQLSNE